MSKVPPYLDDLIHSQPEGGAPLRNFASAKSNYIKFSVVIVPLKKKLSGRFQKYWTKSDVIITSYAFSISKI